MNKLLIIIVVLSIFYLYYDQIIETFENSHVDPNSVQICKRLYQSNDNKKFAVLKNVVTKKFCKNMIISAEKYADKYMWTKKRHDNYPTTDNVVDESWKEYKTLEKVVHNQISKKLVKLYNIDPDKLGINEMFVVKYDISGQRFLKYHNDGSEFSFIIGLNDDYENGGTQFKHNKEIIKTGIGNCLVFSGQNKHKGRAITAGKRYIIAGFLNYGGESYCEDVL